MSTRPDASADPLAARYGRGGRDRRRWVVAGSGLVGVTALGWLLWVLVSQSAPQAQSQVQGWDVVDTHRTTAYVTVTLSDPTVEASCLVRASAADSSVVGERSFVVTGIAEARRVPVEVRTEREADSVVNVGCTTTEQSRPR